MNQGLGNGFDGTVTVLGGNVNFVVSGGILVRSCAPTLANREPTIGTLGGVGTNRDNHGLKLVTEQLSVDGVEQLFQNRDTTGK